MLVSQSAVGYYGDRGDEEVDESDGPGTSFDAQVVQAWEAAAHELDPTGVRLVIARTGQVLSTEGGMLKEMLPPFKLGVGGPLAGGNQYLAWIHIDDEIGILLWALDNENVSGVDQRQLPEPGDEQGVLQGAGPSPQPPGGDAGPRPRPRPQIRQRVRPGPPRRRPRDPEAHRRAGLRVQATPTSTRPCGTSFRRRPSQAPAPARPRDPRSRSARCPPGARPGSRAGAP